MQGPAGGRRPLPLRKGSEASSGSLRRTSIFSGICINRAGSCRSQSTTSDGRAGDRASLVGQRGAIRVFDAEGKDVTPRPLFHSDPSAAARRQSKFVPFSSYLGPTGLGFLSSFSTHQAPGVNTSSGSFSGTYGSSSTISNASTTESILDEIVEPGFRRDTAVNLPDVQVRPEEMKEELTKEDLDKRVDIYLTETETLWIFDMPSVMVSVEAEDAGRVQERNKIYTDICKNRPGNDRFVEKTMQTINGAAKNKEVQCDKIIMEDKGVVVTSWDLYDSFNILEIKPTSKAEGSRATMGKSSKSHPTKEQHQTTSVSSNGGSTTSMMISESAVVARSHEKDECHSEAVLTSQNLQQDLFFMERILMENIFQPKLAAYRQFPILLDPNITSDASGAVAAVKEAQQEEPDEEKDEKEQEEVLIDASILLDLTKTPEERVPPSLEHLWSYLCDVTRGHSVSSMAWSKVNPDLLAVGYGAFDFKKKTKGLVCCWSLKNPMWPERIFQCKHGVTALDFSLRSPNLLAVGMYNGSVAIYNVQSCKDAAIMDSSQSLNKHTGPIWQLRWVEQASCETEDGKRERLICMSADGRITEWFLQKRLDCTDLMKIQQTKSEKKKLPSEKESKSNDLISQQAAGMCFDFHPKDTDFYLTGTDEGHIHKCSCSSNEQFVKTYRGHKGPVYKVAWNPFSTDIFLSCSADWSINLWHQDSQTPILTLSSVTAFVHDIMWSPKSACIFAAANESRVEVWDLSVSTLSPVISHSAGPQVMFTSVLFTTNTNCLLVGDSEGEVGVFELQNLAASDRKAVDALHDIIGPALSNSS
ncbi:dynein axonemal intermediate chain 4 isoform X2 [Columba livia]|uniref:dynein axonemal intermediate chain 4 isoform X2 n=1 Tax=Columba livia TaxID=8932 RepID=UPI0031BB241C